MTSEDRFRRLVESMLGIEYVGPVEAMAQAMGVVANDPSTWAELEQRWEAMRPEVEALRLADSGSSFVVEPTFQAVIERDPNVFDASILAAYPPSIRMLISTRAVEGQVDNGGWPAVFYNGVADQLAEAIDGYRLLGLDGHAALAERVLGHGWIEPTDDAPDDPAWDLFDAAWRTLPDAEDARAQYIKDHPREFAP